MRRLLPVLVILLLPSCAAAASLLDLHNADDESGLIALAAREAPPRDARDAFMTGKALYAKQRPGEATGHLERSLAKSDAPWKAEALWLLADCYRARPAAREAALERLTAECRG